LFWPLRLRALFAREDVSLINVHSPVPILADAAVAARAGRPLVFTYHSGKLAKGSRLLDPCLALYERSVLPILWSRSDAVVAVSPASTAYGWPGAVVIPPGVDTERFVPPDDPPSRHTVVYVGRIERSSEWKGIDVLLEAFGQIRRKVPDVIMEMVGSGDAVGEYQRRATAAGLNGSIRWRGRLEGQELVLAYQRASVVVLPSKTDAESFGMCLVEAMSCTTPVIGSRVGGIPHVIEDGATGLLTEPGDPSSLADACIELLTNPGLRARIGEAGRRQAVSRHDWSLVLARYSQLFERLLNKPA
jgi:glycosyltransferase involved in cell wall biosynthesis